ncbi:MULTISPECIES: glucosaminidase domain-containing protein [Cetobacterium]|uniref:Glucosaminidase domain-containing protein n=1 Tax=Candidatus Cetobacterium colombiensis TaxID=3073100 RepID=A0ABU4W7D0_9FUSO|nr:glucosaminidase domain-containing protein [Candidatus Cetobacterium colombiensis]MDX8335090.1 glucosaminidase domain-containing protein [Candidatus Cetobacterium colombiensis]
MIKKLIICVLTFFLYSSFTFSSNVDFHIPHEINYKTIEVKTLKDLEKKPTENHVYSLDGLDLKKLSVRSRKEVFISMLLPSIEVVNKEIDRDIAIVNALSKKNAHTSSEKKELDRIFKAYKVSAYNWSELKKRMIKYPTSLILSQAAIESGWGTSKVFREKNNLFGMNAYKHTNSTYKEYDSIKDSVKDFVLTLSRVSVYKSLRTKVRAGETPEDIAHGLTSYSELKGAYIKKVQTMLKHNNFKKYDDV